MQSARCLLSLAPGGDLIGFFDVNGHGRRALLIFQMGGCTFARLVFVPSEFISGVLPDILPDVDVDVDVDVRKFCCG